MSLASRLLGESPGIRTVRDQLARLLERAGAAQRLPPLLILGETGTGKGLLAQAAHEAGPRATGPFVDLNCAAIPETLLEAELFGYERGAFTDARQAKPGLFQAAHGGTLFLDEVGLMPAALQAKLLKAIEERRVRRLGGTRAESVDVWVLAATAEDLAALVRARRFREDLYHRLAVVTLRLPPLRERGADVERLGRHFLGRACRDYGIPEKELAADATAALLAYPWPGNVRELANVMERVALLSDSPRVDAATLDLPRSPRARAETPLAGAVRPAPGEDERAELEAALLAEGGNLSRAASRLGVARNTLRYRLERLGLRAGARPAVAPVLPGPEPPPAVPPAPGAPSWAERRVTLLRVAVPPGGEVGSATESDRLTDRVIEKVQSFGGRILTLDAQGITGAFGVEPTDDAPRRAAHAALVIRHAGARPPGDRMGGAVLRMAVHTHVMPVAAEPGGPTVDDAAVRIAHDALDELLAPLRPGEIGVSVAAAPFLRRRFALAEGPRAGALLLLGHADPDRERSGFVGRDRELRLLVELFDLAEGGQARAVTIVGEPGIGKSRLLRELRRALGDRAGWAEGRVASAGRTMSLAPLVDLLHRMLGIEEGEPEAAVLDRLERRVAVLGGGIETLLPYLRYLLSVDPGDATVTGMDPEVRRAAIFDAMRRLLFRAAERQPQVVLIEDAHWIDRATEEWLQLLADGMTGRRLLLVLTARPGYVPPYREGTFHTQVPLTALSGGASVQMACALLEASALPADLERLIVTKTDGNPFFVEEVVQALQEVGAVRREGDRLTLARRLDELTLPDTVQDVILARIERLPPARQELLAVAAVIGRDVPFDVLAAVTGAPEDRLRQDLRELQAAEFLYETGFHPELTHSFRHALTHDVAYARIAARERRALHARIVAAIERVHAGRLADQVERLAHHALRGEEWPKALTYCRAAGDWALARSANREAVACYEQTLRALEHLPETRDTIEQAIDVRFGLRSALIPLGDVARILQLLREAEALATRAGDRRRLGWTSAFMTIYYLLSGDHERAREAGERAVRLGDELADDGLAVVGRAYRAHVLREFGDHERALALWDDVLARLPGERVLERFGQAMQPAVYALSLGALSRAALGGLDEAVRMADEGLRISRAADRPFGVALASLARAQVLTVRWAGEEARALAKEVLQMIEARSLPLWRPWALAVLGWAEAQAGHDAEAVRHLEAAIHQAETVPFLFGHSLWVIWFGLAHVLAARFEAAGRQAARALALTRRRGERGYEAWAHYLTGEVASRGVPPDLAAAEAAYLAALACAAPLGMRPLAAHCHAALAGVLARVGRSAEAAAHDAEAVAAYEQLDLPARPERTLFPRT